MSRRRLSPPLIPGFWSLTAFLLLLAGSLGWYAFLAKNTRFHRQPVEAAAKKAK